MGISSLSLETASLGTCLEPDLWLGGGSPAACDMLGNAALVLWLVFQEDAL